MLNLVDPWKLLGRRMTDDQGLLQSTGRLQVLFPASCHCGPELKNQVWGCGTVHLQNQWQGSSHYKVIYRDQGQEKNRYLGHFFVQLGNRQGDERSSWTE